MDIRGGAINGVSITGQSYLYAFSTFTFTTGGTVGPTGANAQWLFANSYSSSNASNVWLTNTTWYGVSNRAGYQYWVVPETAQYTIEVAGARTGIPTYSNTSAAARYGRGAVMRGTFTLQQGTNVTIAVGQPSANTTQPSTYSTPGGGGGTFVVLPGNFPLIIAGGGGAAGNWTSNAIVLFGGNGQTTTFGGNSFNGAPGGFNGWGGNSHVHRITGAASINGYDGGGGGGFILPGVAGTGGNLRPGTVAGATSTGQGGWHFLANLVGGIYSSSYGPPSTSYGGFGGGGGSGPITGGGGGGYSGGAGAFATAGTAIDSAGGGGSWIAANATAVATSDGLYDGSATFGGSSITNLATVNAGPGYVKITKI